jgi:hypothetical protein
MAFFTFKRRGLETPYIRDKIVIIELLIFILPFLTLLYIIYQGNYHFDLSQVIMFIGIAVFILAGMIILRQILGRFSIIAMSLKKARSRSIFKKMSLNCMRYPSRSIISSRNLNR